VELEETRSESRAGFWQIVMQTDTLGEFRYVNSMPFGAGSSGLFKVSRLTPLAEICRPPGQQTYSFFLSRNTPP